MNKLCKCLVYDRQVSLSVLETAELVNDAVKIHKLDDRSAEVLGGLLTAAAYMAGCLKSERGAISITVKSGDGSATVSVSGDSKGRIRGYIDGGAGGLKGGTLTVIKDDGFFRPFVGTCELSSFDVSENLMRYFEMSEQIPTAVAIGVKVKGGVCKAAGGVVMQFLPGTSQENANRAKERMQAFVNAADVVGRLGAEGILREYFGAETEDTGVYIVFPEYKCTCSRSVISNVLLPLGREELQSIINEEGKISVHCHYCNKDYIFTQSDIDRLLKG